MSQAIISQIPFNGQMIEAQKQGDTVLVALKPLFDQTWAVLNHTIGKAA